MRIIDLSRPLDGTTPAYPGDPPISVTRHASIGSHGYEVHAIRASTQSGTHLDAPSHVLEEGLTLRNVPIDQLVGPGVVIRVRGLAPRAAITTEDLAAYAGRLGPGVIALLDTGWAAAYATADYHDAPVLSAGACELLLDAGVRAIGIDAATIDAADDLACHRMIAGVGGVVIENLGNLDRIDFEDPLVCCLPLPLGDVDGAPCRVIAIDPSGL